MANLTNFSVSIGEAISYFDYDPYLNLFLPTNVYCVM